MYAGGPGPHTAGGAVDLRPHSILSAVQQLAGDQARPSTAEGRVTSASRFSTAPGTAVHSRRTTGAAPVQGQSPSQGLAQLEEVIKKLHTMHQGPAEGVHAASGARASPGPAAAEQLQALVQEVAMLQGRLSLVPDEGGRTTAHSPAGAGAADSAAQSRLKDVLGQLQHLVRRVSSGGGGMEPGWSGLKPSGSTQAEPVGDVQVLLGQARGLARSLLEEGEWRGPQGSATLGKWPSGGAKAAAAARGVGDAEEGGRGVAAEASEGSSVLVGAGQRYSDRRMSVGADDIGDDGAASQR